MCNFCGKEPPSSDDRRSKVNCHGNYEVHLVPNVAGQAAIPGDTILQKVPVAKNTSPRIAVSPPIDVEESGNQHLMGKMEIIATIPTRARPGMILDLLSAGATIFRLNGAHLEPAAARDAIRHLRSTIGDAAKIMIDLPTNKLRTTNLGDGIRFTAGDQFMLPADCFNVPAIVQYAREGDEVVINDGRNHLRIISVDNRGIEFLARNAGTLTNRRGLIFERSFHTPEFPFLLDQDRQLLEIVARERVDLLAVSYLRFAEHKTQIQSLTPSETDLIYKIETREAFDNFSDLIDRGETILIDRGDLAGEIGLLNVAAAQRQILAAAHAVGIAPFVATQLLTSMQQHPVPTLSEIHSLFEMIASGVAGLQLSEETAQGAHPVACVEIIRNIERQVRSRNPQPDSETPASGRV